MGHIYILTGRVFGKDIYEIDYTDNLQERLASDKTGYPYLNKIIKSYDFKPNDTDYCRRNLSLSIQNYINGQAPFYKIELEKACNIIESNLNYNVYTKKISESKKNLKRNKNCCMCF